MYLVDFDLNFNPSPENTQKQSSFKEYSYQNIKQTDLDSVSDSLPESDLKEKVDKILSQWQLGPSSQPKNLLLLLSTLHEVWSREPKLKEINNKELIDDQGLATRTYRRCMLLFHDDKIKSLSKKEQYIAKQLYYILSYAHDAHRK